MAITEFFNSIFTPLMAGGPLFAIVAVSLIISFTSALLYLLLVDQQKMRRLKAEMKESQEKMKKAQKEGNDKEIKSLFSNSMKLNSEIMNLTLKPIIVSMIIFFLIIPWLYTNYGDINAKIVDGKGSFSYNGTIYNMSVSDKSFHGPNPADSKTYTIGDKVNFAGKVWGTSYKADGRGFFEKLRNAPVYGTFTLENVRYKLPFYFPGVGNQIGWLGIYIIVSIPSALIFRKILGVD
ncbi:Uncharacterised protein [uncultured archaeon]|nr:Uncharacterised protein [uncultured archaeon]